MATKKEILDSKLAQFNSKYNLNLSESSLNVRVASNDPAEIENTYKQVSTSVLLEYLSNAMKMRENASYDFTQFSIPDFAAEFEEIMKAKTDLQGIGGRPAYEGVKLNELFDNMKEEATKYSYPLAELWKQSFISGSLTLATMKAVTRDAAGVLLRDDADAPDNMSQRSKNALQSLVAAKQTMDLIREKRGLGWRLRHPILNYREKKYLKELKNNIKSCEAKHFDVEEVANTLQNETLQDTFENLNNHEAYDYLWDEARKQNQKIHDDLIKAGVVYDVIEHYANKVNNKEFESQITQELINVMPVGGADNTTKAKAIQDKAKSLIDKAHSLNENYHNYLNANNVKIKMAGYAADIFMHAFDMTDGCKYNLKGRLLAAQRMTDVIMNNLSPVPLAKDALGQFGDGYILSNPESVEYDIQLNAHIDSENKSQITIAMQEARNLYEAIKNNRENFELTAEALTEVPKIEEKEQIIFEPKDAVVDPFDIFNIDPFGGALKDAKISETEKEAREKEKEKNNQFILK